ncbi:uncharacterized protein LOC134025219 [Osmerus eperlanus]|uniref:uncharacterized protein LOC134025219 n=1 Tax=Osmerus eperlanus TaxID=29151 RepID=UPI002E1603A2
MVKVSRAVLGLFVTIGFHIADGSFSNLHQKVGENISLPCNNVVLPGCSSTTWISNSIELVGHGVIKKDSDRAKRLSLGSDCSLMVLNVTTGDSGRYTCRQYPTKGGGQDGEDACVNLSVETNEITTSASTISPNMKGLTTPLSTTSTPPFTVGGAVGAALGGAIGAVLLCLLAVIIIVHKNRAKNQKPNNDSLALTTDIVSNTTGNQQTLPTNEDKMDVTMAPPMPPSTTPAKTRLLQNQM